MQVDKRRTSVTKLNLDRTRSVQTGGLEKGSQTITINMIFFDEILPARDGKRWQESQVENSVDKTPRRKAEST